MSVKQLSVFLENRPGALYGMTGILSQNKIDMRALSVAETRDFGILRIIVDDPYKTATVLKDELKVLFNQMKEVYYVSKVNSDLATLAAFDMELPVLSDGARRREKAQKNN